jgi:sugar fermentation stimulation protein A
MLKFSRPLQRGVLIKRYKRFFADVRLDSTGETVTAHCPNTGSMKSCADPGSPVWLSPAESPERKLRWTWEYTETSDGGLIGVNTARPNAIVEDGFRNVPELAGYPQAKREVKYGKNSRIDLLLTGHPTRPDCWVEVKNATLILDDSVQFPDAVTERGLKHLEEMTSVVQSGQRAVMLWLVNRPDGRTFRPANGIDPAYAAGVKAARDSGVEFLAWRVRNTPEGSELANPVTIQF